MKRLITILSLFTLLYASAFAQDNCETYFYNNSEGLTLNLEAFYYSSPWDSITGDSIYEEATFVWEFMDMTETGNVFTYTVDQPGEYQICLTATGSESECTSSYCETIFLGMEPMEVYMQSGFEIEDDYTSGWAAAIPEGGIAPYAYQWSNGAATQEITGLTPGTYCVTVTDAESNTAYSCVTLYQDSTDYPIDSLESIFILGFEYEYVETGEDISANVAAYIEGGIPPYTYHWTQQTNTDELNITHEMVQANYDMIENATPAYPVFLTVTDQAGETAIGSIYIPEYLTYEDSISGEFTETVDSCFINGELAMVWVEEFWIENNNLMVIWSFEYADGNIETLTVEYNDINDLIEGIYDLILYIDCPNGMKTINSFSDRILIDSSILDIESTTTKTEINIYPNPVGDILNIAFENGIDNAEIAITDAYGRILETQTIDSGLSSITFNTTRLTSGMYFVNIKTTHTLKTFKFMK